MSREYLEEIILKINKRTNIRNEILEKDYYVCLILKELAKKQDKLQAYFKGGTALYKIINQFSRFSEDIDLTVVEDKNESKTSNIKRLKKSAFDYNINGLELIKEETIDKKQSITAFYNYNPIFNQNLLFKSGKVQIESTSFTISEPTKTYFIEPLIVKYATPEEKYILESNFNVSGFNIEIIKLERIFVDKIFAAEFYYERKMFKDVSKHLYDLTILLQNDVVKNLLKNKEMLKDLINIKRKEESFRIGGIPENKKISDFQYLNETFTQDLIDTFEQMQNYYIIGEENKINLKEVNNSIKYLKEILKNY